MRRDFCGFIFARGLLFLMLLSAGLLAAEPGASSPREGANRARELFKEGRELISRGRYDEACLKFEESLGYEDGIGTRFNWADCLEHRGEAPKARRQFLEVAERAHEKGQADREKVARERAEQLDSTPDVAPTEKEPAAPAVKPEAAPKGAPTAKATGEACVPVVKPEAAKAPASPEAERASANPPKELKVAPPPPERPRWLVPVLLYGGVGGGALLAGTGLVLYARSNQEAKGVCPSGVGCSAAEIRQHESLVSDARAMRTVSYVGFGMGGAALAATAVLLFTEPGRKERPPTAGLSAAPIVGSGAYGAAMSGSF